MLRILLKASICLCIYALIFYLCVLFSKHIKLISFDFKEYINIRDYSFVREGTVTLNNSKDVQVMPIYLWNKRYHNAKTWFKAKAVFSDCPESRCRITSNINESKVILISHYQSKYLPSFPKHRTINQKWIFFSQESPIHRPLLLAFPEGFNATFTYSSKSDIVAPYGKHIKIKYHKESPSIHHQWNTGTSVLWIVSNCNTKSLRHLYVKNLSKYVNITIYGKCGQQNCPKKDCLKSIGKDFKFYLAFENSLCEDYITEKVWKPLKYGLVPIVYGAANYSKYLPPNSFIDVRDFRTPAKLANYLKFLSSNESKYKYYTAWRNNYQILIYSNELLIQCSLCKYLHETKNETGRHIKISDFWSAKTHCTEPRFFLKALGVKV